MKFFGLKKKYIALNLLGSAILAFGLYQVHSFSGITEGGGLGLTLLLHHWLGLSPALSGLCFNAACYALGWRVLGRRFIGYSLVAGGGFSLFYAIFEQFPLLWPQLAQRPLGAAVLGAIFVGLGCGLCVRCGGAPSGDDALALAVSEKANIPIQWVYLASDLTVLGLSLTYIPARKLAYSLLTVIISGQLVGIVQRAGRRRFNPIQPKTGAKQ